MELIIFFLFIIIVLIAIVIILIAIWEKISRIEEAYTKICEKCGKGIPIAADYCHHCKNHNIK